MDPTPKKLSRRNFVQASGAACLLTSIAGTAQASQLTTSSQPTMASQPFAKPSHKTNAVIQEEADRRILKSLKIGMVDIDGTLVDKFKAVKEAGFDGIELDSPGLDIEEAKKAVAESGLPIDGTVCSTHWNIRHTDPDASQRAKALHDLQNAIRDTHAIGGHTALLVVGHGKDGPEEEIWPRAIENISKAVPLAARLGVVIAIENVWNHFLYDHDGNENQSADKFVKFVDELDSPWVGMQFDIGNHWKYGDCGSWIRELGKRVVKLDVKGYSRTNKTWAKLGEDDIDWADVQAALKEINFSGWAAAEVKGGDLVRLKEVSNAMDVCLGL